MKLGSILNMTPEDSFSRIEAWAKTVGLNFLLSLKDVKSITLTTTYQRITGLTRSIKVSGGLVFFIVKVAIRQTTSSGTAFVQLKIDDELVSIDIVSRASNFSESNDLIVPVTLSQGTHKVEVLAKNDANTTIVNSLSDQESYLYAIEFLGVGNGT